MCFNNDLPALQRCDRSKEFSHESFNKVYFWIHIGGMQVEYYTKKVGKKIAGMFGDPQEIQFRERKRRVALFSASRLKLM